MPALSFQNEWLDKLLSGSKRQTTRPQTDRIKIGAVCTLYNQQRRRIVDKPLRQLTVFGNAEMCFRGYPDVPLMLEDAGFYHAHLLGKVEIAEVYNIHPCEMSEAELTLWAMADGFDSFASARCWFETRYGARWMHQTWTVIRWDDWLERYFEPNTSDEWISIDADMMEQIEEGKKSDVKVFDFEELAEELKI